MILDSSFLDFFKRFKHLQLSDLMQLYKLSSIRHFKSGEIIAEQGTYYLFTLGILKGIIRTFILQENGEEKTVRFAMEHDFTGCAHCILKGEISQENLHAVEDCMVLLFDVERLKKLTDTNIRIAKLWNDSVSDAMLDTVDRIKYFVTMNPEQRYRNILQTKSELLHRVPQKYLASYIGVTTVSLSRIRSRVSGMS